MAPTAKTVVLTATLSYLLVSILWQESFALARPLSLNVVIVLVIACLSLGVWAIILWPYFFSPLRHLPGPRVCYAKSLERGNP